jgi:Holliday junction resolvasome RuvABC endonuclease subunit
MFENRSDLISYLDAKRQQLLADPSANSVKAALEYGMQRAAAALLSSGNQILTEGDLREFVYTQATHAAFGPGPAEKATIREIIDRAL